jgi:hypothetical protein
MRARFTPREDISAFTLATIIGTVSHLGRNPDFSCLSKWGYSLLSG